MASQARFYDGRTAQAQEVNFRATASELVIIRPEDSGVLARWPAERAARKLDVVGTAETDANLAATGKRS